MPKSMARELTKEAAALAAAQPEALKARLSAQLAELLAGAQVPPDRLAQEVALLATRADVREVLAAGSDHAIVGSACVAALEGAADPASAMRALVASLV